MKINVDTGVIMQKISFLLLGTSLSFIPQTIFAAECAVTDCSLLGYTDSACPESGLKCPFGDGWYCGGGAAEDCIKLGYDKTCTGAGESGSGQTCNGKYQSCTCANGYEWKDGNCQQQALNGPQGDLYYCNNKVVGVKASGMNFYVAMKDLGRMKWSDAHTQYYNYIFCGNARGEFPTLSQLQTIYNNKSRVNTLLSTNGGTQLVNAYYWASNRGSYDGNEIFFAMSMEDGNVANYDYYDGHYVRTILTSW